MIAKLFPHTSAMEWFVTSYGRGARPETCYDLERTQNRYRPSNIVEKDHYGRGGLMVWEGIMADRHANLHVFDKGTLKGQRYRDETLGPYVKLFH
ncbi:hypothetical protein TNCV_3387211 [Trichonephila clavipes]|nr:hypothetical protein TNCV_3387211 [Trichonephila clavipes]